MAKPAIHRRKRPDGLPVRCRLRVARPRAWPNGARLQLVIDLNSKASLALAARFLRLTR